MFWEKFIALCQERGEKPTPVIKKLGIAVGLVTKWKNGTIPNGATLEKIASYFDVPVDFLLGKSDERGGSADIGPALSEEHLALLMEIKSLPEDQQKEAWDYIQYLKSKRQ